MQVKDLNQKVELWGMTDIKNELGEISREPAKIKDVWAKIIPKHGTTSKMAEIVDEVALNVIVKCRLLSIKNPDVS